MNCSVGGCDRAACRREWCHAHYKRWQRYGDPLYGGTVKEYRPRGLTEAEAFAWFMPGDPPEGCCWDWTGATNDNGYGIIPGTGGNTLATRAAYRIYHGEIPEEALCVLHWCDRPICVQPAHLHLGTRPDNTREMVERDRHAPGERHPNAKLTDADVKVIRSSSRTLAALAADLGVSMQTVSRVRRGERWKHLDDSHQCAVDPQEIAGAAG